MKKGFTLIELLVVVAIIAILSAIAIFAYRQFINKGNDSSIAANLAVLIPAGEAYYNITKSYTGFCDVGGDGAVANALAQMQENKEGSCYDDDTASTNPAGVCCSVNTTGTAWACCAQKFTDETKAFCVDSRGVKRNINSEDCTNSIFQCPLPVVE